jgi:hypothetical protein
MTSWAWPRSSYEARVLLVPLDEGSWAGETEPEGVRVLRPVAETATKSGLDAPVPSTAVEEAVHATDMVVLLVHELAAVEEAVVVEVCDAARAEGRLIAAVVVDAELGCRTSSAQRAAVVLREAVDTVVVLRDPSLATAFIDVLRGGDREKEAVR